MKLVVVAAMLGFVLSCQPASLTPSEAQNVATNGTEEVRAVWVSGIEKRKPPKEYAQDLKNNNVNAAYVSIYNNGKPRWASPAFTRLIKPDSKDVPEPSSFLAFEDAELLQALKDNGIRVIAWVESGLALGADPHGIAKSHPEWLQRDSRGEAVSHEHPEYNGGLRFYSPAHEEAMEAFSDMMGELGNSGLEFDGIQLERIRYSRSRNSGSMGFEKATMDKVTSQGHDSTRRRLVTDTLELIISKIRSKNPSIWISLGADGYYTIDRYFQPWNWWLKSGIVSSVDVQAYGRNMSEFRTHLDRIEAYVGSDRSKVILGYRALGKSDASIVAEQMAYARSKGYKHVALFGDSSNSYFADDNYEHLKKSVWSSPIAMAKFPLETIGLKGTNAERDFTVTPSLQDQKSTTFVKTKPNSLQSLQPTDFCSFGAGTSLKLRATGNEILKLGSATHLKVKIAETAPGCSQEWNTVGSTVYIWGEHFKLL